jgi:hypothetical protein
MCGFTPGFVIKWMDLSKSQQIKTFKKLFTTAQMDLRQKDECTLIQNISLNDL